MGRRDPITSTESGIDLWILSYKVFCFLNRPAYYDIPPFTHVGPSDCFVCVCAQ